MSRLNNFFYDHFKTISALMLSLISVGFFVGIDNKLGGFFAQSQIVSGGGFAPKFVALFFVIIYVFVSGLLSLIKNIPTQDKQEISTSMRLRIKFTIWIQSVIFALSTFLYYTTVKKSIIPIEINFSFLSSFIPAQFLSRVFVLHTGYIFILLIILIFFINRNLFGKNKLQFFFLWAQNLIFAVLGFGFVDTLNADRSSLRNFSSSSLYVIANINPLVWIFLSICAIAFVSVTRLRQESISKNFWFTVLFVFLLTQFVIFLGVFENFIQFNQFGYWHKSLFLTVFWSMIFYPIATIIRNNDKENFTQKTWLSFVYHLMVFIAGMLLVLV
jgi:hypothetical protein